MKNGREKNKSDMCIPKVQVSAQEKADITMSRTYS